MTLDAPLVALEAAVHAADWEATDRWAAAHVDATGYEVAAATVAALLERERSRHEPGQPLEGNELRMVSRLARIRRLAASARAVQELPSTGLAGLTYGVLATDDDGSIALACSALQDVALAADAGAMSTEQLAVLAILVSATSHRQADGRAWRLEPGAVVTVEQPSIASETDLFELASRWRVTTAERLRSWLAADDVLAVSPDGGRIGLWNHVGTLERNVHSLVAHAARPDGPAWNEARRSSWEQKAEDDLDRLRRIWADVEEAGFSIDVEPLSPPAALVAEAIRRDQPPSELLAELRELARGASR